MKFSLKAIARTARDHRPGTIGFANGILVPERFIYPGGKVSQKQIIHLTSFNIAIMITKNL